MKLFSILTVVIGLSLTAAYPKSIGASENTYVQQLNKIQRVEIKAIIFDFDGTLVDNGSSHILPWQYALKRQGHELNAKEFWDFMHQNKLIGNPGAFEVILKYSCELLGRDCSEQIIKDIKTFSKTMETYEFPTIESTFNFLQQLGEEKEILGLKLGIASANTKENILRFLKRQGVEHYFDAIASYDDLKKYSDPEGTNKPKPYVYLEAAKLLGMHPSQCVAVEDSHTGLSSAVNAGCVAIAIPNAQTMHHDFSQAHFKILSFQDMTPADFLQIIAKGQLSGD
jgi:beta-phosphoglucomutase-like phosphatase (HAD superfamily)